MAYTADEYLITVEGMVGPSESWSNTWCMLSLDDPGTVGQMVAILRNFYQGLDDDLSQEWSADTVTVKNLGTGATTHPAWESIPGLTSSNLLPTQLAVRISLDDLLNHNGGPFISGWTEQSNTADGLLFESTRTHITAALSSMKSSLVTNDIQLRINRPSVGSTVAVLQARVGERFDVIRKRGNDTPENYATVSFA